MMERTEAKAVAKTIRIAPRKTRLIIDLIRGKSVNEAYAILRNQPQKAARVIEKVLTSAVANAENNLELDVNNLYVEDVVANQGPTLKRIRPRAQGRAYRINKRTAHISIYLNER